jgi:hypothetical protein
VNWRVTVDVKLFPGLAAQDARLELEQSGVTPPGLTALSRVIIPTPVADSHRKWFLKPQDP